MIHLHDGILCSRKKEGAPTFATAWMELEESIMLSEISQAVKDKYHTISPIMEPNQQNKQMRKNRIREMEIKNKLTVTRGERGGVNGRRRRRVKSRNMYKGPMDKDNGDCLLYTSDAADDPSKV